MFALGGIEVDVLPRGHWDPTYIGKFWTSQQTVVEDVQQLQAQKSIKEVIYSKATLDEQVENQSYLDSK